MTDIDSKLDQIERLIREIDETKFAIFFDRGARPCIGLNKPYGSSYEQTLGFGPTLREAYAAAAIKRAEAEVEGRKLKTAAEMRDAVLAMIPEHSEADFLRGRIQSLAVA
jgi:hypothetical protein